MYSGTVRRHTGQKSPMQRSSRLHFPDPAAGGRPHPTRAPDFPPFFLLPFSSRPEQGPVRKSRKLRRIGTSSYRTVLIKDKNEQGLSFHPSPPIDTCRTGSSDGKCLSDTFVGLRTPDYFGRSAPVHAYTVRTIPLLDRVQIQRRECRMASSPSVSTVRRFDRKRGYFA